MNILKSFELYIFKKYKDDLYMITELEREPNKQLYLFKFIRTIKGCDAIIFSPGRILEFIVSFAEIPAEKKKSHLSVLLWWLIIFLSNLGFART